MRNKYNAINSHYTCDPSDYYFYFPYDSSLTKHYHLYIIVVRDDSGNGNGEITDENIDSMVTRCNRYYASWNFEFSYTAVFIDDSDFLSITPDPINDTTTINFINKYCLHTVDQINVAITNIPTIGLSGNPLWVDYSAVSNNNVQGGTVLAHELGHDFTLLHEPDINNIMYASYTGTNVTFDSIQAGRMHCYAEVIALNNNQNSYHEWLLFGTYVYNNLGVPYSRFYQNHTGGCAPLIVSFIDSSSFNPTSWLWDFGDGTTDSNTHPSHIYKTHGVYTVSLITTNSIGSDTLIKNDFIIVSDSTYSLPYIQNFENTQFPPTDWYLDNSDQQTSWERNTDAQGISSSVACAMMEGVWGGFWLKKDGLISPTFDLRYTVSPYIEFKISYPLYNYAEATLNIYASRDCNISFDTIYSKQNKWPWTNVLVDCKKGIYTDSTCNSLFSMYGIDTSSFLGVTPIDSGGYPLLFSPQYSSDWRTDKIYLTDYQNDSIVSFMFEYYRPINYGEIVYIDDIVISANKISGLPVANFTADTTTIYKNDTIHFTNLSNKYSDTLQWLFTGATITTSNDTNPSIIYDSVGIFPVTLVVWNMFGRDTLTKLAYINVLPKIIDTIPCDSMKIILSKNDLSCKGKNDGTTTASAFSGNSGYSFSWSNGSTSIMITGLAEGTYTVTITDSIGCTKTDSVKISYIDSLPVADFSYADTGNTVNFTNLSTNADSSLWNFGDDSTETSPNPTHIYSDFGTYEACLIAMNNCGADTLCKSISILDGIKESTGKINLQIFPNPNSGTFTIIIEQPQTNEILITLTNILGQKIYTNKSTTTVFKDELNLTNFSKGLYSLKIVTNTESISRKVVYR